MMAELEKIVTVGLLWHSMTSGNLGVRALAQSHMLIIAEAARKRGVKTRFIIVGLRGEGESDPIKGFEIVDSAEFSLRAFISGRFKAFRLLRQCDIVFDIGDGDSFADIYGNKRLALQVLSKLLVHWYRRPLILSPQTIGPFNSVIGKWLGSIGMRMADRVYVRDHLSMEYLNKTRFCDKATEVSDVAFVLPYERPVRENQNRVQVGINVSGLLYSGGYSRSNEFGLRVDYRVLIEKVCEFFLAQEYVGVYLVPHVITNASQVEDDLRISQDLIAKYPNLQLAPNFRSPSEAKGFISGMDFFTGARMHACIAAFSSGVPVLPMAYSRKFSGLFNSLGYSHVLDCLTTETVDALQMVVNAFECREQLAIELKSGNEIANSKIRTYTEQIGALLSV